MTSSAVLLSRTIRASRLILVGIAFFTFTPPNELSDRHLTLSVASQTDEQIIRTLRRSQSPVPVRWSALR